MSPSIIESKEQPALLVWQGACLM